METSLIRRLAAKAPKTNIVRRMLEEKTFSKKTGERCIYKKIDYSISLLDRFTIASRKSVMGLLFMFNEVKQNTVAWMNSKSVFETNLFFYLRKGAPDGKRLKTM